MEPLNKVMTIHNKVQEPFSIPASESISECIYEVLHANDAEHHVGKKIIRCHGFTDFANIFSAAQIYSGKPMPKPKIYVQFIDIERMESVKLESTDRIIPITTNYFITLQSDD